MFSFKNSKMTSAFGLRKSPTAGASSQHGGMDFGVPVGTPITCEVPLRLIQAKSKSDGNGAGNRAYFRVLAGRWVGHTVAFFHLDRFASTTPGQVFMPGATLAWSGNTGTSTGPHIHFVVQDPKGAVINPAMLLRAGAIPSVIQSAAGIQTTVATRAPTIPAPVRKPAPAPTRVSVVVSKGDTVWDILKARFPTATPGQLAALLARTRTANAGLNLDRVRPGQKIWLPK